MIKRDLELCFMKNMRYFPVITITGPRQSGKTTLIRNTFSSLPYYTMENPMTRDMAISDPMAFLSQHDEGMILDEVQNTPVLLSYLQGIVDDHRDRRFILSGSSQFSLLNGVTQTLAGRTAVLELLPLSLRELQATTDTSDVNRMLYTGFYPAIHAGLSVPHLFYPAYTRNYIERDVRNLLQVKDLYQFQTFLRLCAGRIGSLFNASELSNEVGVSVNTIRSWVSILQASYIVFLIHPYYENTRKRLTRTPKLYFYDTGLACYLLGIKDETQLAADRLRGHLFENMVVADLIKRSCNAGKENGLLFYRDSNGNEIDILVPDGTSFSAYEIKSSSTYNSTFEKGFRNLPDGLNARISRRAVIYTGEEERHDSTIEVLHYTSLLST